MRKTFLLLACLFLWASCNTSTKSKQESKKDTLSKASAFPEVQDIGKFKQTEFLPTLEHTLPADKNSIYAASLLYAWEELQKTYKPPFQINPDFKDLLLINASQSFKGVLKKGEYTTSTKIENGILTMHAFFEKSLVFPYTLSTFTDELTFDKNKVKSFGLRKNSHPIFSNMFSLWYYDNDKNFILKLAPKDEEHEILLCMFGENLPTFASYLQKIAQWQTLAEQMKQDKNKAWRFYYDTDEDIVMIPKFQFNIEKYYDVSKMGFTDFKGQKINFKTVSQRTAFLLNESGAKASSDSKIEMPKEEKTKDGFIEMPHPKNLVFDKPFLLLLKRKDNPNPYFAMWVSNSELMEK